MAVVLNGNLVHTFGAGDERRGRPDLDADFALAMPKDCLVRGLQARVEFLQNALLDETLTPLVAASGGVLDRRSCRPNLDVSDSAWLQEREADRSAELELRLGWQRDRADELRRELVLVHKRAAAHDQMLERKTTECDDCRRTLQEKYWDCDVLQASLAQSALALDRKALEHEDLTVQHRQLQSRFNTEVVRTRRERRAGAASHRLAYGDVSGSDADGQSDREADVDRAVELLAGLGHRAHVDEPVAGETVLAREAVSMPQIDDRTIHQIGATPDVAASVGADGDAQICAGELEPLRCGVASSSALKEIFTGSDRDTSTQSSIDHGGPRPPAQFQPAMDTHHVALLNRTEGQTHDSKLVRSADLSGSSAPLPFGDSDVAGWLSVADLWLGVPPSAPSDPVAMKSRAMSDFHRRRCAELSDEVSELSTQLFTRRPLSLVSLVSAEPDGLLNSDAGA